MSARSSARHAIACALGIETDDTGSRCVLCGASPFATAGPTHRVFGAGFSDWVLCDDPDAPDVCQGCAALLAGKPGRVPPPLRMRSFAVRADDGLLEILTFERMWAYLTGAERASVLSWAVSGQKHHALHAELTTDARLAVGSDDGCIRVYRVTIDPLIDAILTLRAGEDPKKPWCTRAELLSGQYRPQTIARDPGRWERAESVLAPRRGSLLLALLVGHAPVLPPQQRISPSDEGTLMDDAVDQQCAHLLMLLARDSTYRVQHGKAFWGGVFERRVRRHVGRPLPELISRLATDLQVPPISSALADAMSVVAGLSPTDEAAVSEHLRSRTTLLIALAFQRQQEAKQEAKAARAAKAV